jgi:hypothetical protein
MRVSMRQVAASSRSKFLRELYTRVAEQEPTPNLLDRILDSVITDRMR